MTVPEFDFAQYDPRQAWYFPARRIAHFAAKSYNVFAESRGRLAILHQYPDLRYVFLHELCGFCMGLSRSALLMEDKEGDTAWWAGHAEPKARLTPQLVDTWHQQARHLMSIGFLQSIVRLYEQSLRQIYASLFPEDEKVGRMKSSKVEKAVMAQLELPEFSGLLRLLQVLRDALAAHGKFRPVGQTQLLLGYKGRSFEFDGQEIDYKDFGFLDFWDMLFFLLEELDEAWSKMVMKLQGLAFLKTPFLD